VRYTHYDDIQVGSIVKMNPFTRKEAQDYGCDFFNDERDVWKINDIGTVKVRGSNNWKRQHLLVKGVDYT
jgi:hypothetical protein